MECLDPPLDIDKYDFPSAYSVIIQTVAEQRVCVCVCVGGGGGDEGYDRPGRNLYSSGNFGRKCVSTTPICIWPRAGNTPCSAIVYTMT